MTKAMVDGARPVDLARQIRDGLITAIDLSMPLSSETAVYPNHVGVEVWVNRGHETTKGLFDSDISFATCGLRMGDHSGTHIDAPSHIDPAADALPIDSVGLERLITAAICLDMRDRTEAQLGPTAIAASLDKSGLTTPDNGTVLIRTGHYERERGRSRYLEEFQGLSAEAVEYLADAGATNIGIDAPSIDAPVDRGYPAHRACRNRGLLNTENLANLELVSGRRFLFVALALPIVGGTGSPVRAVALLGRQRADSE